MRKLAIAAVAAYKRHLSPRKGFGCAYRIHVGGASCSTLALRAVRMHGAWFGLALLRQRLARCSAASRHRSIGPLGPRGQAGFVDLLGACDTGLYCASCGCDALDLFDWSRRRARRKGGGEPRYVDIRPGKWR